MPRARGKDRALKRSGQWGPAGATGTDTREGSGRSKPTLQEAPAPVPGDCSGQSRAASTSRPWGQGNAGPPRKRPHLAVQFLHGHQVQGLEGVPWA